MFNRKISAVLGAAALLVGASSLQPAKAETTIEMAYMPIVPCSQLFVMEGMGWTKEAGINLKLTRFPNGPAIVQAIASGKMDAMCFGIGPAMVSRAKGANIRVVAPGIVEQISVIAQGDLVGYFDKFPPKEALMKFTEDKGRKPKIASFPKGSVPDTVTRHWIVKMLGLKLTDVELIGMGASRVQQALLTKSVDAAGILEPIISIVEAKLKGSKVVARAKDMMPGQPGSTLAIRENVIAENRDVARKMVELHIRATEFLRNNPSAAAPLVNKFVSNGAVEDSIIQKAITYPTSNFRSDPSEIVESTKYMQDFQRSQKAHNRDLPMAELFDNSLYQEAVKMMKK